MSQTNIKSSIVYQIREEREKRSTNCMQQLDHHKNKINFCLSYEEFYQTDTEKDLHESKLKARDHLLPIPKMNSVGKKTKNFHHAKKISLNFDLFNPKRRLKEEGEENGKINYQQLFMHNKQKYLQKIDQLKRKKSEKCKNITIFGLNIKTVDQTDERPIIKRESRTKDTFTKDTSNTNILNTKMIHHNHFKVDKKFPSTHHKEKRDLRPQERSKSFALSSSLKDGSHIKVKLFRMVNSSSLVLQSYGLYLGQDNVDTKYKFYVGNGNNRNLIRSILKQRWWWVETSEISAANFVWTQLKHNSTIDRQLQVPSQLQQSSFLQLDSQKDEKADPKGHQYLFFHEKLDKRLRVLTTEREKRAYLKPFHVPQCVHNHFSHNYMLGNKNALFENLSAYYHYKQEDVFTIIPLTYFIDDIASPKFADFLKISKETKNSIWIVKPGENSNRGNGIFVCRSGEEIRKKLARRKIVHTYIIQKYITNPMLYHRRKFDIRTYMLMVSIGGVSKYFWYEEGYLRTSSEVFDLRDLNDFFIHLTNDAIQKKSDTYGKFQNGNKIAYSEFQRYLDSTFPEKSYSVASLNQQMKSIAKIAVKATYNKLDPHQKAYGFQLFGLDFIVDSCFKPWLIEVNTNPCLQLSSPTLERIIPRMMENLFRLALDPVFQASEDIPRSKSYYIYDNCLQKNKFQIIFDSLFDRDFQWEALCSHTTEKVYEEDKEVFQEDGVEIQAIY